MRGEVTAGRVNIEDVYGLDVWVFVWLASAADGLG